MTASAFNVESKAESSIFIPLSAVYQTGDSPMVWVVQSHKTMQREVRLGKAGNGEKVQVIEGLAAGDEIVTTGVHKLSQGQQVRTQPSGKDS